jgi:hypothetical protein
MSAALRDLLIGMSGRRTLQQLAAYLHGTRPALFADERAAMDFAARCIVDLERLDRGGE